MNNYVCNKGTPVNPTVIYSSYLQNGNVKYPELSVAQKLAKIDITKVVIGHQPHGDAPMILDTNELQVRFYLKLMSILSFHIVVICHVN